MEHVYILFFFTTFALGIIPIAIAGKIYKETGETRIRYFLYFYVPFTIIVVISALLLYVRANIPDILQAYVLHPLRYIESISVYILVFTIPLFAHSLFSISHNKIRNRIFGGMAIITYIGSNFFMYAIDHETFRLIGKYLGPVLLFSIIIYVLVTGIYQYRKIKDPVQKKLALKVLLLITIFLPALLHDVLPVFLSSIRFFPLLYCGFSLVFSHHLLTYYRSHIQDSLLAISLADPLDTEEMFTKYDVSPREREIVHLLLQGYSNRNIADSLCIALSTVKTHLRNIYPKLDVGNRYELLIFFNSREKPHSPSHNM